MSFASKLKSLFTKSKAFDEKFFENLEEVLIEGDLGSRLSFDLSEELQKIVKKNKLQTEEEVLEELKKLIAPYLNKFSFDESAAKPRVIVLLGVNGVGKTTTCAKLINHYQQKGLKTTLVAGDTFRAAAIEQLMVHGERLNCRVVKQKHGSDPAAVVYDALESAKAKGDDIVIIDTAGRLESKDHLMNELAKIDKVAKKHVSDEQYSTFLVLDSTTGQNAYHQAELFNQVVKLDALVLAKTDSMAKGGFLVQIGKNLDIPVAFTCDGEAYHNISEFNKDNYLNLLVGK